MYAIMTIGIHLRAQIAYELPRQLVFHVPLTEAMSEMRLVDRVALRAGLLLAPSQVQGLIDEMAEKEMPRCVQGVLVECGFDPIVAKHMANSFEYQVRLSKTTKGAPLDEGALKGLLAA